jgi:hypothetical protein
MSDNEQGRNGRFTLKAWHAILAIILVLAGLIALYIMIGRARLNRRLEALRAAGYPTTLAELAEYNKLPAGAPNAAGVYMAAFGVFAPPLDGTNTPQLGAAKWPDRGKPLPEPMAKAISQCLTDNQQCLSLLHEAGGIQDCDYDWDWQAQATGVLPRMADMRHCAQLLALGAVYYSHTGDPNAAVRCIEDGLRLADSLRREPAQISYLVRVACVGLALANLEQSLNVATLTDGQLAELDKALAATAGTLDLTQALITERCIMIEACRDPLILADSSQAPGPRMLPGMTRTGITDILDYTDACIEACKLPPPQRLMRFREATKKVEDLSFMHVMIKSLAPALGRAAELDARVHAHLDLAGTALAIERYRLATSKVPERLEELVPQYLKEVPIDPFDGQPIRYRRTDPGYRLYSIGEDGQDNGGKEKAEVSRGDPYDWPFIVTR